jgi:hypothetical protein
MPRSFDLNLPAEFLGHPPYVLLLRLSVLPQVCWEPFCRKIYVIAFEDSNSHIVTDGKPPVLPGDMLLFRDQQSTNIQMKMVLISQVLDNRGKDAVIDACQTEALTININFKYSHNLVVSRADRNCMTGIRCSRGNGEYNFLRG